MSGSSGLLSVALCFALAAAGARAEQPAAQPVATQPAAAPQAKTATVAPAPVPDEPEEEKPTGGGWHFSAESDAVSWALGGWSLLVGVKTPEPGLRLVGAVSSANHPQLLVNQASSGWSERIELSYSLALQYFFGNDRGGLLMGVTAGVQHRQVTRLDAPGEVARALSTVVVPHAGYQWFPVSSIGLYALPWLGLSTTVRAVGELNVGGQVYREGPFDLAYGVHIGYQF